MKQNVPSDFPQVVGDGSGLEKSDRLFKEELQLAFRNRGMPLEALRYPITPTGMHYLLTHYDIPYVDIEAWTLEIGGEVTNPMTLTLEEIKQFPAKTFAVTMECAGNGRALLSPRHIGQPWILEAIGTAEWTGTPLRDVLGKAGLGDSADEILFTALDRGIEGGEAQNYQRSLEVGEALREEVLLVYEMNGQPLPVQHGYPLRLIVPGWYGMASVKWLDRIEAIEGRFHGYQMMGSYRYSQSEDDAGKAVTLIKVRALMNPPGIPDFLTRTRFVKPGSITLSGRAWAGRLGVSRVEVSVDDGSSWSAGELGEAISPHAWREWRFEWDAISGPYTLCVRATDSQGNVQSMDPQWNLGGFGNNMVQRINVVVE